jgi:hypothetical protein
MECKNSNPSLESEKRFTLSPKYKVNWTLKTIRLDFDVNFFEIQYYSKGQLT